MSTKQKNSKNNLFKLAIENTSEINNGYHVGLQAFKKEHKPKIEINECQGSVDIDGCLIAKGLYANDNRWDYAIGHNNKVYFVEVHTANTREVKTVLNKLQWLKDWLTTKAPEINKLKASPNAYFWIQSNNYKILKGSRQAREISAKGLKAISKLTIPIT